MSESLTILFILLKLSSWLISWFNSHDLWSQPLVQPVSRMVSWNYPKPWLRHLIIHHL